MKIAVITTSQVPASTANSIQALKVCQALAQVSGPVRLWVPGIQETHWDALANHYGLQKQFEITWLPSRKVLRRYDFALQALSEARRWGAQVVYTWTAQAAVLALYQKKPLSFMKSTIARAGDLVPGCFAASCTLLARNACW
jgi:hypothetical protein